MTSKHIMGMFSLLCTLFVFSCNADEFSASNNRLKGTDAEQGSGEAVETQTEKDTGAARLDDTEVPLERTDEAIPVDGAFLVCAPVDMAMSGAERLYGCAYKPNGTLYKGDTKDWKVVLYDLMKQGQAHVPKLTLAADDPNWHIHFYVPNAFLSSVFDISVSVVVDGVKLAAKQNIPGQIVEKKIVENIMGSATLSTQEIEALIKLMVAEAVAKIEVGSDSVATCTEVCESAGLQTRQSVCENNLGASEGYYHSPPTCKQKYIEGCTCWIKAMGN